MFYCEIQTGQLDFETLCLDGETFSRDNLIDKHYFHLIHSNFHSE